MQLNDILAKRSEWADKVSKEALLKGRCHIYAYAGFGKTNIILKISELLGGAKILYIKPASDLESNRHRFKDYPNIELASYTSLHKIKGNDYELIVADESDYLASFRLRGGSKRARDLYKLAIKAPRFISLSATLYREDPLSLYGVQMFVDHGKALGRHYSTFGNKYFHAVQRQNYTQYKEKPDSLSRIVEDIKSSVITVQYSDVFGDLPEYEVRVIPFRHQKEVYDAINTLEKDRVLDTRTVAAGITRITLMLQVASGFYIDEEKVVLLSQARFLKCQELVERLVNEGKSVLVFANYIYEQLELCNTLKHVGAEVFGKSGHKKDQLKKFIAGELKVLISHPETLGVGVDGLQNVCYNAVYFNLGVSLRQFYQSTARISTPRQLLAGGTLSLSDYSKGVYPTIWILSSGTLIEREIEEAIKRKDLQVQSFKNLTGETSK